MFPTAFRRTGREGKAPAPAPGCTWSGEPSYTIDSLDHFRELHGRKAELLFILGTDAFVETRTWHRFEDLFSKADFIVMTRPGTRFPVLGSILPAGLARSFHPEGRDRGGEVTVWRHTSGHCLRPTRVTHLDVSSSDIRERVRSGCSIRYLTPEPVVAYIRRKALYRST